MRASLLTPPGTCSQLLPSEEQFSFTLRSQEVQVFISGELEEDFQRWLEVLGRLTELGTVRAAARATSHTVLQSPASSGRRS